MTDAPDAVDDAVLEDLREKLRRTRMVPLPAGVGWERGADADDIAQLVHAWIDFDWRDQEARLLALPWRALSNGGRVIHQPASDPDAPTVVLLHGWPDSFLRFERVLPLLGEWNVVVPALPGFPYGRPVTQVGTSTSAIAEDIADALTELGYERYVVSGGDVGSGVAESLAAKHPDRVSALHLTDIPYTHIFAVDPGELTEDERQYLEQGQGWQFTEGAYALEQSTKPHTLAVALGDSPAGLLAWIVEKLRAWSDSDGRVESVWSREELLTWVTLYWVTGAIGTSFSTYVEESEPVIDRVSAPTVVTIFPHDLVPAPRAFGERFFDIRHWDIEPDGGHFAAWERPDAYVAGLRKAVDLADH